MNISTYSSADKVDENEILQKQRETFITSLSHDLKNPTGKFDEVTTKQREIMEMLLDSCRYMNAMLGSVLATYRNEKGMITLDSEKVSIVGLVEECSDEMTYIAKEKGVKIIYESNAEKEYVWGDLVQLRRVVMNLLTNSIKYAYSNTDLKIKVYNENNYTCFKFENASPYLPPEKRDKIFARYISFTKTHNGIGLGLYVSKKIVEAHNGTMFVKSFKDERNTFGFKIPNDDKYRDMKRVVSF